MRSTLAHTACLLGQARPRLHALTYPPALLCALPSRLPGAPPLLLLQDKLAAMWQAVGPPLPAAADSDPEEAAEQLDGAGPRLAQRAQLAARHGGDGLPESVADLRVGELLHEFTERKHVQLALLLEHGRGGARRLLDAAAAARAQRAAAAAAAARGPRRVVTVRLPPELQAELDQQQLQGQQGQQQGGGRRRARLAAARPRPRRKADAQLTAEQESLLLPAPGEQGPTLEAQAGAAAAADAASQGAAAAAAQAPPGVAYSALASKQAKQKQRRQRQRAASAASGREPPPGSLQGAIVQVERRRQQREEDIRRRWGRTMGCGPAARAPAGAGSTEQPPSCSAAPHAAPKKWCSSTR